MRIAVGIIGLMTGLLVFMQSCVIAVGSDVAGDAAMSEAGAAGLIIGLLYGIGGAFAFGLPLVSVVVFAITALCGFAVASQGNFEDLQIWAGGALVLAVLSFFAWRSRRDAAAVGDRRGPDDWDRLDAHRQVETPSPSSPSALPVYDASTGASAHRAPAKASPSNRGLPVLRHYTAAMRNYAIFTGRASRAEFFGFYLVFIVMAVVVVVLDQSYFGVNRESSGVIALLFAVVHILPGMAVQVRRLHDIDWSGWWILLNVVPLANIMMIVLTWVTGTAGPNRFGPAPGNEDDEFEPRSAVGQRQELARTLREPAFDGPHGPVGFDPQPVGYPSTPNAPLSAPQGRHATTAARDPIADLERLAKLRDNGTITDEEFQTMKAEALAAGN